MLQRLELPPKNDDVVVHRILDDNRRVLEVSPSRYFSWRMRDDLVDSTIVASDFARDISVRTTFSVMPENRDYRPFGTSVTHTALFEPLVEYSQRYETWEEAERGHRDVVDRVGRDLDEAESDREIALSFVGLAAEVRESFVGADARPVRGRPPRRRCPGAYPAVAV